MASEAQIGLITMTWPPESVDFYQIPDFVEFFLNTTCKAEKLLSWEAEQGFMTPWSILNPFGWILLDMIASIQYIQHSHEMMGILYKEVC